MRFAYLGSGSKGNAALIEADDTCVMLDCGFGPAEAERRLRALGKTPADIDAILVTHEHGDHAAGVATFARRYATSVHLTAGTAAAMKGLDCGTASLISCHRPFGIGTLEIHPLPVPHDAREPCQFVFGHAGKRLGIVTDAGHVTAHMVASLSACDALLIECNHDAELLAAGPYPPRLKRRVGGRFGHLSNAQGADLLQQVDQSRLDLVLAVHLSEVNNRAELALDALSAARTSRRIEVGAVPQHEVLPWVELA